MTIREFQETIEFNIDHHVRHSVLGLGAPGVGKSQAIRQVGEKYGFKVIDIRLAQMSEVEIGGLIYPNADRTRTVWLAPDILPNEERDGKNNILLLDEITSCTKRVQVAAYQLILDRRVGQYKLPEGTFVVALGNREDDDGVYIHLAGPLADRFEIHYIESDFEDWKNNFALTHGIHPYVIDYLSFKPSDLHTQDPESGNMVFATPRSWERVSDILNIDSDITKTVIRNKILGNIGIAAGTQFLEFCKKQVKSPSAREILAGGAVLPTEPTQLGILTDKLVNEASFLRAGEKELTEAQRDRVRQVILALVRLPRAEYTLLGLKKLLEMNREEVRTIFTTTDSEELDSFIRRNSYALGIDPDGNLSGDAQKNWMDLWK